jgi:ribosomal protein L7/L12
MSKESLKDLSLEEAKDKIETLEEAIREARIHANSRAKHILSDALKETDLY